MNSKFLDDYYRMTGIDWKIGNRGLSNIAIYPHIRYMYWWRSFEKSPSFVKRLILLRYAHKYGLEISPTAKIGKGFYLGHPYNITVAGG